MVDCSGFQSDQMMRIASEPNSIADSVSQPKPRQSCQPGAPGDCTFVFGNGDVCGDPCRRVHINHRRCRCITHRSNRLAQENQAQEEVTTLCSLDEASNRFSPAVSWPAAAALPLPTSVPWEIDEIDDGTNGDVWTKCNLDSGAAETTLPKEFSSEPINYQFRCHLRDRLERIGSRMRLWQPGRQRREQQKLEDHRRVY